MEIDNTTRVQIVKHYREYSDIYEEIWERLDTVHKKFNRTGINSKLWYLKLSYINSVISIRTPVPQHEEALSNLMERGDLKAQLENITYGNNKYKYILQSLDKDSVWNEIVSDLNAGDIDAAHRNASDNLLNIGTVKTPFLFANLGYTEKMCLDGNISAVLNTGRMYHKNIDEYKQICSDILRQFPELQAELDPYHLQWVIFDWKRYNNANGFEDQIFREQDGAVTTHKAWFDAVLRDPAEIGEVIESID